MLVIFFSDKARRVVIYFYGGFSVIRINLPTKLCRFRQGFVVSDKRLSFPTKLCRFRQALLVSDKALSFPTSALSEIREFRNLITPVTARRVSCPPVTLRNDKKIRSTRTQTGTITWYHLQSVIQRTFVSSWLADFRRVFGMNEREWITASCKNLRAVVYCSCTWDEEHPITIFHVKR